MEKIQQREGTKMLNIKARRSNLLNGLLRRVKKAMIFQMNLKMNSYFTTIMPVKFKLQAASLIGNQFMI